jgi:cytochrome c556
MKRLLGFAAMIAALTVVGVGMPLNAADEKTPSISDIMKKCNGGPKGLCALIGKGLQAKDPDWAEIQKEAKDLVECASFLPKTKAPKGDQVGYEKLSKSYVDITKDIQAAADKKEQKDAAAAQKKLTGTCKECHTAYRPAK